MPYVEEDNDQIKEQPSLVINPTPFEAPVVDTRATDYDTLSTFYSGYKLAGDMFKAASTRDSTAMSFDVKRPAAFGSTILIRGFELVIQTPFSNEQNAEEAGNFDGQADAIVYSVVTPNNGDMFIADYGNGRNVLIGMYNPKRTGVYNESPTRVDLRVIAFLTKELYDGLMGTVIEELYFDRENFRNGVKCLLNRKDVDIARRLHNSRRRLINLYFKDFFVPEFSTFIMPMQETVTYDPAVVKFLRQTLSGQDHPNVHRVIELDVTSNSLSDQLSLFDMMAKRDWELLYSCSHHFGLSPVSDFYALPKMHSIYFSGINRVVMPRDISYSASHLTPFSNALKPILKAGVERPTMRGVLPALKYGDSEPRPEVGSYIHRVLVDDYYVFSQAFYEGHGEMSHLERMVEQRMKGQAIDLVMLAAIADYAAHFDNLERYYYIPIILTLIKLAPGVY